MTTQPCQHSKAENHLLQTENPNSTGESLNCAGITFTPTTTSHASPRRSSLFEDEIPTNISLSYSDFRRRSISTGTTKNAVVMPTTISSDRENCKSEVESRSSETKKIRNVLKLWKSKIVRKYFKTRVSPLQKKSKTASNDKGYASDPRELTLTEKYMGNYDLLMRDLDTIAYANSTSGTTSDNRNSVSSLPELSKIDTVASFLSVTSVSDKARKFFSKILKRKSHQGDNETDDDNDGVNSFTFRSADQLQRCLDMDVKNIENPYDIAKRLSSGSNSEEECDEEMTQSTTNTSVALGPSTTDISETSEVEFSNDKSKILQISISPLSIKKSVSSSDLATTQKPQRCSLNTGDLENILGEFSGITLNKNSGFSSSSNLKSDQLRTKTCPEVHSTTTLPVALKNTGHSIASRIAMLNANIAPSSTPMVKPCISVPKLSQPKQSVFKQQGINLDEFRRARGDKESDILADSMRSKSNIGVQSIMNPMSLFSLQGYRDSTFCSAKKKEGGLGNEIDITPTSKALEDLQMFLEESKPCVLKKSTKVSRVSERIERMEPMFETVAVFKTPASQTESLSLPPSEDDDNVCEFDGLDQADYEVKFQELRQEILANRRYHNSLIKQKNIEDYQRD
ncbi:hypothetical protein WICPIJ_002953 [Wickerhamomyces pijperi]|uniref:Uncharacterized protein n=1 Tax=Wickerhamomyces pijperi TaxID=599730 RepID=A0A9P8TNG3_WICPI|nr:hypothetical protein WICPIJ_002953 [Wickerhamomyces pijperi]